MPRPTVKSYSELQRQHITAELRQRQAATREAALSAWQTAADDLALTPPPVKLDVVKS